MTQLQQQTNDFWPHILMRKCIGRNDASTHYERQGISDNQPMHEQTRPNIKRLLTEHDMSERQLAIACGMSQTTLNRFLKGHTETLDYGNLRSIAHYFDLTVSQLTGETPLMADRKIQSVVLAMEAMPDYKKDMLVAASSSLLEREPKRANSED
jgi:transcriptional regulator with XRE-family HTH domain